MVEEVKEKQIEEMAGALKFCKDTSIDECHAKKDCHHCISEQIYNAGYRKQSEGEWLTTGGYPHGLVCSECRIRFIPNDEWIGRYDIRTNFCPNCGAKMKGGE